MSDSVISLIDARQSAFSKGQRSIADFVRAHYDEAAFMTAARLAAVADVSEPTVVRFAILLGYKGYPEFIRDVQEYAKNSMTLAKRFAATERLVADGDYVGHILGADAENIRKTAVSLDAREFESAVGALALAQKIYISACGFCAPLASFAAGYLSLVCDGVSVVRADVAASMCRMHKGDALLVIVLSKLSRADVAARAAARERGGFVVVLTDVENVERGDATLICKSGPGTLVDSVAPISSVLSALLSAVCAAKRDELSRVLARLEAEGENE